MSGRGREAKNANRPGFCRLTLAAYSFVSRVRALAAALSDVRCAPGQEILRIDFAMPTESMKARWEFADQSGMSGMPSGLV